MKTKVHFGQPFYCDTGANQGNWRVDINASVYMSPEELEEYTKVGLMIIIGPEEKEDT